MNALVVVSSIIAAVFVYLLVAYAIPSAQAEALYERIPSGGSNSTLTEFRKQLAIGNSRLAVIVAIPHLAIALLSFWMLLKSIAEAPSAQRDDT